ncbi:50S ribosomal protein L27 [Patescibacteria group bacterium]|nr:50S ribosomal protein L27 [Patescibacteria group bacterium]
MSKTKSAGSTKLGRDSRSQRLGVKAFAGEKVAAGNILVRQRGAKILAGENTKIGSDDTIYAVVNGTVSYREKNKTLFTGLKRSVKIVSVNPAQ